METRWTGYIAGMNNKMIEPRQVREVVCPGRGGMKQYNTSNARFERAVEELQLCRTGHGAFHEISSSLTR
jgi:hypothetical protein